MTPTNRSVQPMIDLSGESGFVRVYYHRTNAIGIPTITHRDLTFSEWHTGDYEPGEHEDHFLYDPVRECYVRVADTRNWYRGIREVLEPEEDDRDCPF